MYKNNERILVVGGTGFIGQHVVQHAISLGFDVTVIARSSDIIKHRDLIKIIHKLLIQFLSLLPLTQLVGVPLLPEDSSITTPTFGIWPSTHLLSSG